MMNIKFLIRDQSLPNLVYFIGRKRKLRNHSYISPNGFLKVTIILKQVVVRMHIFQITFLFQEIDIVAMLLGVVVPKATFVIRKKEFRMYCKYI